ncbi:MAG: S8 family serine peptidase, partial [Deinococcus sp.]|nr:S8 family serine peptidase [Deinococcus sp.]
AAVGNNGIGGAGVAPDAKIVPMTITHSGSGASYWDSANAFVWAVTGPDGKVSGETGDGDTPAGHRGYVDVVNYSFGGDNYSQILREGIQFVLQHGVVFVTSAGNTPTAGSSSGAWVPGVISVAATTATDTRTTFSNRGSHLSVAAPGENIWVPGTRVHTGDPTENNYAYVNGTSFAGPATAGAAALILSAAMQGGAVNLTPAQVRHILEDTAYSPAGGYTTDLGYGVVRADRAVDMALNDAPNRVEKGASLDMRFVAQSDPSVGIPLVGVTLKGSERRPDQLLYGQSSAGEFVYPSGHASFYEIDAGDYQMFASGPRPLLTGTTPGNSVANVRLAPGEKRTLGDQAGVPLNVALPADSYEPNNVPAQAAPITYGQALEAVMSERDTDLYSFSAQAGETAFINTQTLLGSPNLKVRVLDSSGKELASNTSFRSGLRDAALAFRVPASGPYFAEVTDEGAGGAFNTYLVGLTRWQGQAPEQNEAGRVTEGTFSGVDWSKAVGTAVGEAYEGTLASAADVDTFRLSARAGQTLVIGTLAHENGKPDLLLGLFGAQGQLLTSNDDFTTQDSLITFKVPSDGDYFVAAASYNAESQGTYTISFMEEAAQ